MPLVLELGFSISNGNSILLRKRFCRSLEARMTTVSYDDLFGLLLTEERQLGKDKSPTADLNQVSGHSQNYSGRGRGRGRQQNHQYGRQPTQTVSLGQQIQGQPYGYQAHHSTRFSPGLLPTPPAYAQITQQAPMNVSALVCRNCKGIGHYSTQCPSPRLNSHCSSPQSNFTTVNTTDQLWIMDSGATHHLTSDLGNLHFHSEYFGPEEVQLGPSFQIGNPSRLE